MKKIFFIYLIFCAFVINSFAQEAIYQNALLNPSFLNPALILSNKKLSTDLLVHEQGMSKFQGSDRTILLNAYFSSALFANKNKFMQKIHEQVFQFTYAKNKEGILNEDIIRLSYTYELPFNIRNKEHSLTFAIAPYCSFFSYAKDDIKVIHENDPLFLNIKDQNDFIADIDVAVSLMNKDYKKDFEKKRKRRYSSRLKISYYVGFAWHRFFKNSGDFEDKENFESDFYINGSFKLTRKGQSFILKPLLKLNKNDFINSYAISAEYEFNISTLDFAVACCYTPDNLSPYFRILWNNKVNISYFINYPFTDINKHLILTNTIQIGYIF